MFWESFVKMREGGRELQNIMFSFDLKVIVLCEFLKLMCTYCVYFRPARIFNFYLLLKCDSTCNVKHRVLIKPDRPDWHLLIKPDQRVPPLTLYGRKRNV